METNEYNTNTKGARKPLKCEETQKGKQGKKDFGNTGVGYLV